MRTLIVDDDFTSRQLLQEILSRYGKCYVAGNGREAVDVFRKAAETGLYFDLVCMDILMPEMDGFSAVREIRALEAEGLPANTEVKIIMTTASSDLHDVFRLRDLCNAWLVKPVDSTQLVDRLKSLELT